MFPALFWRARYSFRQIALYILSLWPRCIRLFTCRYNLQIAVLQVEKQFFRRFLAKYAIFDILPYNSPKNDEKPSLNLLVRVTFLAQIPIKMAERKNQPEKITALD